ncbi:MAG: MerR family transcriptional regulator [Gammaproteobacteria bacterium]
MPQATLRIGQLAKELNTTTKTLRFYEDIGLFNSIARSDADYRLYDANSITQARLVIQLRRLGFSLRELKELFNSKDTRSFRQRVTSMMDEKLRDTDENLVVLQGRRDDLAARHQALLSTSRDRLADCICDALLSPCTCAKKQPTK